MSDFKFSCPACGQHIACDTSNAGMNIACPACQTAITVPQPPPAAAAPAGPPGLSIASSQARHTASEAQSHAAMVSHTQHSQPSASRPGGQKTSALAIASLVCSLTGCLGFIPGIICGHLARRNIRRDPALKGGGLATAGLIISYLSLVACVATLVFGVSAVRNVFKSPEFKKALADAEQKQKEIQAGHSSATATASAKDSSASAAPQWNLNLTTAQFPEQPAAGKISGQDFTVEAASVQNGIIVLRQGQGFLPDRAVSIFTFAKNGESVAGRNYDISPANSDLTTGPSPQIHITWKPEGSTKSTNHAYVKGFALKLQLDNASADGKIPAKIYLCLPDDQQSYVAGSFVLEPKTPGSPPAAAGTNSAKPKRPRKPKNPPPAN